ncbi:MAG: thiamine pyrophosphate-binding protein [Actinobacteria bacterium]|nr:thiamine pyrophosphate-binding protein [Actinomycetota bacterium]
MSATVASSMTDVFAHWGIRRCYTVPGESFLELIDAVEHHPRLRLVSTRHESGAAFMAEADAKLTGTPAVAMATRGPGAANLAIGVHTAHHDSTPMLVVLGQVETALLGREAFQEIDLAAFYAPITKWSATAARADRVPELIARGLRIATSGRPGPVMVAVPGDLFAHATDRADVLPDGGRATVQTGVTPGDRDRLARLLSESRRPVLVAGGGARDARTQLVSVAEQFGLGVYCAFRRQDVFPNDHPHYLGHLGIGAPEGTLRALADADLVVVIGCRLSEITTQGYRLPSDGGLVAQIDIDATSIGATIPVDLGIVADAGVALAALSGAAPGPSSRRDWSAGHRAWLEASTPTTRPTAGGVHPGAVISAMREVLSPDAIVANDAGNFSAFLHRFWSYERPRTQLAPTSGAMGYGIPAAVAAKLACPSRTVVAAVGDGGLLMTGHEIETSVRYQAPIIVVVFQNGLHGTIAMHQARELGQTAGVRIGGPLELAAYARGLGARGLTVEDESGLADALVEALGADTSVLIDVRTDPDIISPTARLSQLLDAHAG